ncbi:MAG: hypothetical protein KF787_06800 [Phycisphaeraceae bacterium]|nr:hypothetical protein [Phycisphaerae bacterium]MBX3392342.1 hypothetical protein [Phycisphaeraceae bacterium]HRJ49487.1 prenyltransferase/squalene oxidase repeat-containing protein [Phycisphaerales bacterium]
MSVTSVLVLFLSVLSAMAPHAAEVRPAALPGEPPEHERARGRALVPILAERAIGYLKSQQDPQTGGWRTDGKGPIFPAVTGLVVTGMLLDPSASVADDHIRRAVAYILSCQKPDGGIYDASLPGYNTSICVSALTRVRTPEARAAVERGVAFLRTLQYSEASLAVDGRLEGTRPVGRDHAFYGGVGYGRHGRPDLSNLGWMLDALRDAGVEGSDEAFQRALVFLQRTQMLEVTPDDVVVNDMPYAKGSRQGGFIYSTSLNQSQVGSGQSMSAGMIEETLDDGTRISRLRAYGSMTYAGFKSYLYADLPRDDPRVQAALHWIRDHYSLAENPGLGSEGLYYYYVVMARALASWGEDELMVRAGDPGERARDGHPTKAGDLYRPARWADDLADRLATLQRADGSFESLNERWMENDPVLITAYSLIALRHAHGSR